MTQPPAVPDTSDALATPAALVRQLRGAPVDEVHAAELVLRASAIVRAHCNWSITRQTDHEFVLDGPGSRTLFLPTLALTALSSVTEDGEAVDLADLEWSAAGMVRRRSGRCWTHRFSGVRVVATHGLDEVPEDVAAVVLTLAAKAYANPIAQQAAGAGVVNDQFGRDHGPVSLTAAEKALLAPWRA